MTTVAAIIRIGSALGALAALWWAVDFIGDQREAKVLGRINAVIEKTNVDVRAFNTLDDKIAAIREDARQKALADARKLEGRFILTDQEAEALGNVR